MAIETLVRGERVHDLAEWSSPGSVSIWMPCFPMENGVQQDPIRLKNLLEEAERRMVEEAGIRPADARRRLAPGRAILDEGGFRKHVTYGLGLLLAEGQFHHIDMASPVREVVTVGMNFYLRPVVPLADDLPFYVLALSAGAVRLLRCTRRGSEPVALRNTPENLDGLMQFIEEQDSRQFHTETGLVRPGARRPAVFHGQGGGVDAAIEKKRLEEYCHMIDAGVRRAIDSQNARLVLAAAEPLASIYRHVSSQPALDERLICGSPDRLHDDDLRRRGLELLSADADERHRRAIGGFNYAQSIDRASSELDAVLSAARMGAVATLFVAGEEEAWGRQNELGRAEVHEQRMAKDEELLNLATVLALRSGGKVLVLERDKMPHNSKLAATFRFPLHG